MDKMPKKARKASGTKAAAVTQDSFPIVGLGASAGGLEAFRAFFSHLPANSGMAFILVQHLDPSHASSMVDLLKRYTRMSVLEATDTIPIQPNHVYMIPPNKEMTVADGALLLLEQSGHPGIAHSIDIFFHSLARELKERAIAIILSGTGTDGTLGAKAIKAELGLVLVQDPKTARYDGMPLAAVNAGVADFVLPVEKMAEQLIDYVRHSYGKPAARRNETLEAVPDVMKKIFAVIRSRTKHDFSGYKPSTLKRRIERRMSVKQIDKAEDYIRLLQESPQEAELLVNDFLINVTGFFRDPEAFAALTGRLGELLERKDKEENRIIRIWSVGCSSGEEAYSLAIILHELMDRMQTYLDWQIFATDLDREAIVTARQGKYPENIAADVSPGRLKKFFSLKGGRYTVNREIREKVIFSLHDVASDPPFSHIDLISARNLLIYMNSATQKKLIPLFHYALNNGGLLFLGSAETIGEFTDYFSLVDRKWRIYQALKKGDRLPVDIRPRIYPPAAGVPAAAISASYAMAEIHAAEKDLLKALPPSVLIDEAGRILYVHGDTGKYLQLAEGAPSSSVMDMARRGINPTLGNAVNEALFKGEAVIKEGASSKIDGDVLPVKITVKPVATPRGPRRLAVIFEDSISPPRKAKKSTLPAGDGRIKELEQELQFTSENLRRTVEELETANEELRSANEEYQSTNEELQSTNEELETSREELQSVNEELVTVNAEHQQKIEELSNSNDDMQNLLNSTDIATVFLDQRLRIKRFTPAATTILNLIEGDVGRPLAHITSNLKEDSLSSAAQSVLDNLVPVIREVATRDGRWHFLRLHPYRTTENMIAGVVMSFVEISEQKLLLEERDRIIDMLRESVLVLNENLEVISANQAFYRIFQMTVAETVGKHLYDISKQLDFPPLRRLAENTRTADGNVEDIVVESELAHIGRRTLLLNGRRLHVAPGAGQKVLLVIEDITELKKDSGER